MKKIPLIYFCIILSSAIYGQKAADNMVGRVSFITSQNTYVKFKSTAGISAGDTLFIKEDEKLIPAFVVNSLSSTSCMCNQIITMTIPVDHLVVAVIKNTGKPVSDKQEVLPADTSKTVQVAADTVQIKRVTPKSTSLRGSISAASYSDISDAGTDNSQRFRYTLSLNAGNIGGSRLSFETYISFRHKAGEWQDVADDLFSALKIYNLSARYDINKTTSLSAGRKINPKISSIGAIDGVQFEKSIKNFSFGILAGSRPGYTNYGFDPSLFQYGGYISLNTRADGKYTESTAAFIQQTNNFVTDRRFLYIQHSNNLIENLRFFGSLELDLYKLVNDVPQSTLDMTGLYLSLSYRLSKVLSLNGSYDARKNVMYYETYKSYTERIIEDELRQGYRLGGSLKIARSMSAGLQAGYRFLRSDPHSTANVTAYYTWSDIPGVNLSATVSATWLHTSYTDSKIAGLNIRKDFPGGKLQAGAGYHFSDCNLPENSLHTTEHIAELNFYWFLLEKVSLSVNYEGIAESGLLFNRLYIQVRKRF